MNALSQNPLVQKLAQRWRALAARERSMLMVCITVVLIAAVWWLLIAPPLKTTREIPEQQARAQAELQHMLAMQTDAQALMQLPRIKRSETLQALERATRDTLGLNAKITVLGDQASLTLREIDVDALSRWLEQVREGARLIPAEIVLQRVGQTSPARWSGSLVFYLPAS